MLNLSKERHYTSMRRLVNKTLFKQTSIVINTILK